jgi:hypothetical protein
MARISKPHQANTFSASVRPGSPQTGSIVGSPGPAMVESACTSCTVGPTGQIRVAEFVPDHIPASVRRALADCEVSADNKGQHTINLAALGGLRELCEENRETFRADVLIASDGPRLSEHRAGRAR